MSTNKRSMIGSKKSAYGKGKRSKKRAARRQAEQITRNIVSGIVSKSASVVLEGVKESPTPDQICAWLNRQRRTKAEPDKYQAERPLSETKKSATGGNRTQFGWKPPHNNPQCALGYNVD